MPKVTHPASDKEKARTQTRLAQKPRFEALPSNTSLMPYGAYSRRQPQLMILHCSHAPLDTEAIASV